MDNSISFTPSVAKSQKGGGESILGETSGKHIEAHVLIHKIYFAIKVHTAYYHILCTFSMLLRFGRGEGC